MSDSNHHCTERVWDRYIEEPFRSRVARETNSPQITKKSALVVIDLYNLVYEGGDKLISELIDQYPSSCGEHAFRAIKPTNKLIALFRDLGRAACLLLDQGFRAVPAKRKRDTSPKEQTEAGRLRDFSCG